MFLIINYVTDNQKDVANGVDESNLHVPGSTAEDTKLNGTSNNAAECGPSSSSSSSSQGLNGSEEKPSLSSLSLLLNDDESDDDDDDEEDDKTFEMTKYVWNKNLIFWDCDYFGKKSINNVLLRIWVD